MCVQFACAKLDKCEICDYFFCSKFLFLHFILNGNFPDIILFLYLKVVILWLYLLENFSNNYYSWMVTQSWIPGDPSSP